MTPRAAEVADVLVVGVLAWVAGFLYYEQTPNDAAVDTPNQAATRLSVHAYCEPGPHEVNCRGQRGGLIEWTVYETGDRTIASMQRGGRTSQTYVYVTQDGATKQRITLDQYGRVQSTLTFVSPHRYSMRERNGANALDGCSTMDFEVDKAGHVASTRCLGRNGEPMLDTDGVARRTYRRDAQGIVLEQARFALDGAPIADTTGVHRVIYELDPDGRDLAQRYRGIDDKPVASNANGCHGVRSEYDRGLEVRSICIGADDKPTNETTGTAIDTYAYDARGCEIRHRKIAALGSDHSQDRGDDYLVDEQCQDTRHTCVNGDSKPKPCGIDEPARYDHTYDRWGRVISTSHYDVDGSPTKEPTSGVFELRSAYDDLDNQISIACFDASHHAVVCGTYGFHQDKSEYDAAGRELVRSYFDTAGNPTTNKGAASRHFTYDNYDRKVETTNYDANGTLIEPLRYDRYDVAHRRSAIVMLDKRGNPAVLAGCFNNATCTKPWNMVRIVRGADGTVTNNQFFDATNQWIETVDCKKARCIE